MYLNGTEVKIDRDYKVLTTLDLDYQQLSNGSYVAVGRGVSADIYETEISTYGRIDYINSVLSALDTSLDSDAQLLLSGFAIDGAIFGDNIDYSNTLTAVCKDYGFFEQNSLKGYKFTIQLRLLNPTFSATASLPDFTNACISVGYTGDINRSLNQYDSYYGSYYVNDDKIDSGIFTGTFNFTRTEVANLREWMRVNRDTATTITALYGVLNLFGPSGGSYPQNVKIINMIEDKRFGVNNWTVKLTFAKQY